MTPLDFSSLIKAITSLEDAIDSVSDDAFMQSLTHKQQKTMQAGVIQNFEFSYELCWKMLKRKLNLIEGEASVNLLSRKDLYRLGAQKGLIETPEDWFIYHQARNETSHTYDENKAKEVYKIALTFLNSAQSLLTQLKSK